MKTKALISGGGIAGLTLALLLSRAGLDTALIDPHPPAPALDETPNSRTLALWDGSLNVLKACGLWDTIKDYTTPLQTMRLIDDSNPAIKPVQVEFQASDIGLAAFGCNISNDRLRLELFKAAQQQENLTLLTPGTLQRYTVDAQGVTATLADGRTIEAAVIIGCDGRGSVVREGAGIGAKTHDYGQQAITCVITHTKPHNFTSTEHHRPGGPFTFVPQQGNQCAIVWVEKTADADKFMALNKQAFTKAIQDRSHGLLGTVTLACPPQSWPLKLLSVDRLTAPRMALAAEAAHVISPIGAQGLNLSLRDVATLAETLIDAARLGQDIGAAVVLDRYENRRRPDLLSRVIGIDAFNRAVANDIGFIGMLRRVGLSGLNHLQPLKHFIMTQGLAPPLDEGRLLQGQSL